MTEAQKIEPYENSLSVDELRRELRYYLDLHYDILFALHDVPELPSPFVLMHLGSVAKYPEDWERGKQLQRERGLDAIPPKTECELGAGLWERVRKGLVHGMNVYEVRHDGHWLGGVSVVVAKDEARAEHLTKLELVEHGLPGARIHHVRKLNVEEERCFVLDNGEY